MAAPDYDGDHDEGDFELGNGETLRERAAAFSGDEETCSVAEIREQIGIDD